MIPFILHDPYTSDCWSNITTILKPTLDIKQDKKISKANNFKGT